MEHAYYELFIEQDPSKEVAADILGEVESEGSDISVVVNGLSTLYQIGRPMART